MKLYVEKLSKKMINTARGPAEKVAVRSGGIWYSCFSGPWNSAWKEGQNIDVEVSERTAENGAVYHNIMPPPQAQRGAPNTQLAEIKKQLDRIEALLTQGPGEELPPPHTDADAPPEDETLPF